MLDQVDAPVVSGEAEHIANRALIAELAAKDRIQRAELPSWARRRVSDIFRSSERFGTRSSRNSGPLQGLHSIKARYGMALVLARVNRSLVLPASGVQALS